MSEKIKINVMGEDVFVDKGITYKELAEQFKDKCKERILAVSIDNEIRELCYEVEENSKVEFLDETSDEGQRIYTKSMLFIMIKAIYDLYGKDRTVIVEHRISKSVYCEFEDRGIDVTKKMCQDIENRMKELSDLDIPIERLQLSVKKVKELFNNLNLFDKTEILKYRRFSFATAYKIDDYYDYFYDNMAPSTGYIKGVKVFPYNYGFIVVPDFKNEENEIPLLSQYGKLSEMLMEQMEWCRLVGVKTISELNKRVIDKSFWELVRLNEALHEKKIGEIADMICKRLGKVKIVLIAGPSSSGKTTFAQRLCVHLHVNGIKTHVISMDNYFIERDKVPVDENGKRDYENVNVLDMELFNSHLLDLINGKEVSLPYFNFLSGKREYHNEFLSLGENDVLVIEGIHALNEKVTSLIPQENKFRIFISALMQLNIDNHNRISTTDTRLIRRIVRDYNTRGYSAETTIERWPSVTAGELKNIFPYQQNADVMFNSATMYELSILKLYVEPLLFSIDNTSPQYVTVVRLIKFLDCILAMSPEHLPNNSIIREFVGNSCYKV